MKKLVIDLGHGGTDPGAIGQNGTHEANVVLAIGKELNDLLKCYDVDCKFTRFSDEYISLSERANIANAFGADYFVSIHINSAEDTSVRGVEVWQYDNRNEKLINFSEELCEDVGKIFNIRNRGVKFSKELYVLRNTNMPACLIEVDFVSNKDAENDLKASINIKSVATAIMKNILTLYDLDVKEDVLYKVCIGAYNDKNNAINQTALAKQKGFLDTYII